MTEEEAKTKWCPMVVFMLGGGMVRNRDACYDTDGTHCIGSACMMWRWDAITPQERLGVLDGPDMANRLKIPGYCGLAGKL